MFRKIITALFLAASAPAAAQDLDLTPLIAEKGLAAAEASLTGDDDPASRFALGGVRFLRAVERSLQLRYRHNATFEGLGLPVLRLPVPSNPDAQPFDPGMVADIFRGIASDMEAARAALAGVGGDVAVTLDVAAIWFDINENGVRDEGEGIVSTGMAALGAGPAEMARAGQAPAMMVRFDGADAAWLRAYTHMLSGVAELVLAFDPTDVIADVAASNAAMRALRGTSMSSPILGMPGEENFVDIFAAIHGALNQQPDAARTRAARDHWLAMVAENRAFWRDVALETDNDREWIPNATQTAALGFQLPPETGATWLRVLDDAEAVLKGELLIWHWRTAPAAGINLHKLMENPVPVDIVAWIQGRGLVSFMERGTLVSTDSLRRFERMFGGDALLFMVVLN